MENNKFIITISLLYWITGMKRLKILLYIKFFSVFYFASIRPKFGAQNVDFDSWVNNLINLSFTSLLQGCYWVYGEFKCFL